jgi:hypothetical protein
MKNIITIFISCLLLWLPGMSSAAEIPFPLPEGYFVKAKMPMHVVFPRPDSETQSHARHRWAHPQMDYEIPIGVQGGAWPFKYELVKAPAGAAIGSLYGDENYGSIRWTPNVTKGTAEFVVRVTDQELNKVDISWKVTIDPSMFVFIKAGASGAKTGSIDAPLSSFADWYKSPTDATYKNKIVVLRAGTYQLVSDPAEKGNMRLHESYKTPSLIAFPGEEVVFNTPNAKIMVDRLLDMFIAGITWKNARNDQSNAHFFWLTGDVSRATFWRNTFKDIKHGQVGTDNTGPVFISSTPKIKTNILYKQNVHDGVQNQGYNGHYIDIYRSSYVLVEENIARNSASEYGFWMKATVAFVTVRANQAYENVNGGQVAIGYGVGVEEVPHDHEVCWNRIVVGNGTTGPVLLFAISDYYQGQSYNSFIYRNTISNGYSVIRFPGKTPFETDANLLVAKTIDKWDTAITTSLKQNIVTTISAGMTDSIGKLQNADFGKIGADVAVKPAPLSPINPKIQ